jgi:hypothetical protein
MKRKCHEPILTLLFILASIISFGQTDSVSKATVKPQFKLGVYYNTNLNYYGRVDSLRSSGVFPLAEFWLNKSFYINAAPIFVHNKSQSFEYAGAITTIGYRYTAPNNKLAGNFYLVKPFYPSNSQLPQSALKAQGAFTLTALNKYVNVTGGADVKFSKGTDFGATGGLDHIFRIPLDSKSVLVIDPSAYVNAGTQKFTETYYQNTGIFGIPQQVTKNTTRFEVLSYELSIPVVVGVGKLQIIAIPAYVIPQNLISIPNRPDLSERGENLFYATLGVKFNF